MIIFCRISLTNGICSLIEMATILRDEFTQYGYGWGLIINIINLEYLQGRCGIGLLKLQAFLAQKCE